MWVSAGGEGFEETERDGEVRMRRENRSLGRRIVRVLRVIATWLKYMKVRLKF